MNDFGTFCVYVTFKGKYGGKKPEARSYCQVSDVN